VGSGSTRGVGSGSGYGSVGCGGAAGERPAGLRAPREPRILAVPAARRSARKSHIDRHLEGREALTGGGRVATLGGFRRLGFAGPLFDK